MLNDFGIDILHTQQSLLEALGPVIPDQDWHEKGREAPENLTLEIEPEALSYVIYTSAFAGKPKAAQISHRVLANFLQSMQRELGAAEAG